MPLGNFTFYILNVGVIIPQTLRVVKKVNGIVQRLGTMIESLQYVQIIVRYIMLLDVIEEYVASYEEVIAQVDGVQTTCESQVVNEKNVPLTMVKEILTAGGNIARVVPYTYYAYIEVEKIMEVDKSVVYVLQAPLFTGYEKKLDSVATFPMKHGDQYVQILPPPSFVLDLATKDLYFPDECHGPVPKAYRPGIKENNHVYMG